MKQKKKRWWLPRYSLRSICVAWLLIGCIIGWFAMHWHHYRVEQQVIAQIYRSARAAPDRQIRVAHRNPKRPDRAFRKSVSAPGLMLLDAR